MDFDWKINGGHKQETREGYNLLDLTSLIGKTETKNGVTYKINEDCSITLNGTPTDYISFNLLDMSLKAGTYKFVDGLNTNNVFLQTLGDFQDTSQNHTFSLAEDGSGTVYLVILAGTPTLNNVTLYPMIHEGTEDKPYEQYGTSPSPDYPSEIETVNDSVEIDVCNKQLYDVKDIDDTSFLKENDYITLQADNISGTSTVFANYFTNSSKIIKPSTYYYLVMEVKEVSGTGSIFPVSYYSSTYDSQFGSSIEMRFKNLKAGDVKVYKIQSLGDLTTSKTMLRTYTRFANGESGSITFRLSVFEEEPNIEKFVYTPFEKQSLIMPVQQEMLEGDYIEDVEHHEWGKIVLDGENIKFTGSGNNAESGTINNYMFTIAAVADMKNPLNNTTKIGMLCNYFAEYSTNEIHSNSIIGIAAKNSQEIVVGFRLESGIDTIEKANAFLVEKNTAGTPVTIYYKLATQLNLELTSEQKVVREQKLYTYKNITNIAVSDKLASIDVNYKKDLETMFNNIIKQIPSSTSNTAET